VLARSIPFAQRGTNFNAIFQRANRAYDRIIILSDMQG
jgi:60 kDa SS-A/Ro ribonucleoprotein